LLVDTKLCILNFINAVLQHFFKLSLIWQPERYKVGEILEDVLNHSPKGPKHFYIMSAYVNSNGVKRLEPVLQKFKRDGGKVYAMVGIGQKRTSKQGLQEILKVSDEAWVFHNNYLERTFHLKVYALEQLGKSATVIVGSSNLTGGGLDTNYEVSAKIKLNLRSPKEAKEFNYLKQMFQSYKSDAGDDNKPLCSKLDDSLIRLLEAKGLLDDEDSKKSNIKISSRGSTIFGSKAFPSRKPIKKLGWILVHTEFDSSKKLLRTLKKHYKNDKKWGWRLGHPLKPREESYIVLFECNRDGKIVADGRVKVLSEKPRDSYYNFSFSLEEVNYPTVTMKLQQISDRRPNQGGLMLLREDELSSYIQNAYKDSKPPKYLSDMFGVD
jgi:HKD family nuclease